MQNQIMVFCGSITKTQFLIMHCKLVFNLLFFSDIWKNAHDEFVEEVKDHEHQNKYE